MKIDRNLLNKLLMLNDRQLSAVINRLISEAGLDLGEFNLSQNDLNGIRQLLASATDEDIDRIGGQLDRMRGGGK